MLQRSNRQEFSCALPDYSTSEGLRFEHFYNQLRLFQSRSLKMKSTSSLMKLPAELRNQIYRYAIVQNESINVTRVDTPKEPALLATCKLIRKETLTMFYHENKFHYRVTSIRDGDSGAKKAYTITSTSSSEADSKGKAPSKRGAARFIALVMCKKDTSTDTRASDRERSISLVEESWGCQSFNHYRASDPDRSELS